MMKSVLIGVSILTITPANAQIQLEHSFSNPNEMDYNNIYSDGGNGNVINLSVSGKKILRIDTTEKKFKLYNMDYTLWKTINFPNPPAGYNHTLYFGAATKYYPQIRYISENLFNSDNLIEFFIEFQADPPIANNPNKYAIMNEQGVTIQSFDGGLYDLLRYDKDNFKLRIVQSEFISGPGVLIHSVDIYSLPGTLPCDPCSGNVGLKETISSEITSEIIPNPSSNNVTVTYKLPSRVHEAYLNITDANGKLVKTIRLTNNTNSISISNAELSSGTYYCNIVADGAISTGKKMIVLK